MKANDRQVGGTHYQNKSRSGAQHWDVVWDQHLDYFQAMILKYTMRHREKGWGADLLKAKHFLEKYIELEYPEVAKQQETSDPINGPVGEGEAAGRGYVDQDRKTKRKTRRRK